MIRPSSRLSPTFLKKSIMNECTVMPLFLVSDIQEIVSNGHVILLLTNVPQLTQKQPKVATLFYCENKRYKPIH